MPVYVDNAQNRKLGRVGLEKGKNKPGPKPGNKAKPNKPGAKKPGPKPKPKPTADSKIKIYGEDVLKTFQEKGVLDLVVPLQEQITGGQQAFYVDIANAPEPEIEPEPQLTMLQKKALEKQNFPSNIVKSGGILQSAAEQQVKFGGIIEQKAKDMALLKSFQSPIVAGQSLGSLSEFEIYDNWTMEQEIAAKLGTGPPKPKLPNYNLFFVEEWMRPEKVLTEEEKVLAEAEKDAKDIAKIMAKGQYKYLNPSWKFLKEFEEEGGFFGGDYTQEEDPDKVYESPDSEDFYSSTEEEDSLSEPSEDEPDEDEPAPESMSDLSDSGEEEELLGNIPGKYQLKVAAPAIPSMSIKPAMNTMLIETYDPTSRYVGGSYPYNRAGARNMEATSRAVLEAKRRRITQDLQNDPYWNPKGLDRFAIDGQSELVSIIVEGEVMVPSYGAFGESLTPTGIYPKNDVVLRRQPWINIMKYSPYFQELYRKLWVEPVSAELLSTKPHWAAKEMPFQQAELRILANPGLIQPNGTQYTDEEWEVWEKGQRAQKGNWYY